MNQFIANFLDLVYTSYTKTQFHASRHHNLKLNNVSEVTTTDLWDLPLFHCPRAEIQPKVKIIPEHKYPWGFASKICFKSGYSYPNEEPENRLVWGRYYHQYPLDLASGKLENTRPTLVILPGWLSGGYYIYRRIAVCFIEQGFDCLVLALPYHMERTPSGSFSGECLFTPDLTKSLQGLQQSLLECLQAITWLQIQGIESIGTLGISLGGLINGLITTREPGLKYSMLWVPAACLEKPMRHSTLCQPMKERIFAAGVNLRELQFISQLAEPAAYLPAIDRERILFVEGMYDQIIKPIWIERWWKEWGEPHILRVPHSHISGLIDRSLTEKLVAFAKTAIVSQPVVQIT